MSKLCQCKRDSIKNICLLHRNNHLLDPKENGYWFWLIDNLEKAYESDCVCEKKEFKQPCFYCPYVAIADNQEYCCTMMVAHNEICTGNPSKNNDKKEACTCDSAFYINGSGVHRPDCIANTNQQKVQSPCEHEWEKIFLPAFTVLNDHWQPQLGESPNSLFPLYICRRKACGLVTCKNPNQ